MIGFGEVSVALGYPMDQPTAICKRTPPMTAAQFEAYRQLVDDYVERLTACGLSVVPTSLMAVGDGERRIGYLIQPILPAESIGSAILEQADPDPDHAFLTALAGTLEVVSPEISIDAQISNWSWDGDRLTLIDVGTPFMWDEHGSLRWDMGPISLMGSLPIRAIVVKDMTRVVGRWREPRQVATDVVGNLYREGLDRWVDPTVEAIDLVLAGTKRRAAEDAHAMYLKDAKTFPRLKKMQQVERLWQTRVRRRPYDFFVQETTYR